MKVFSIGQCAYDVFSPLDNFLGDNRKYYCKERLDCGGGTAANVAYLLGKWGISTFFAGVIGADDFGAKIKKELESVQVDVSNVETNYEKPTILEYIIINKSTGTRTIFNTVNGNYSQLKKYDYIMEPELIFIDGHEFTASREALNKYPEAISVMSLDQLTPERKELAKYIKYLIFSKDYTETITNAKVDFNNPKSLVNLYQLVKNIYPNNEIIITMEDKGALYVLNNEIKIMPGLKKQVKDATGCKDIFCGAFMYGLANKFDLEKSITYANIAAGLSLEKIGTRPSMPELNEVINRYNEQNPHQTNASQQASSSPNNNAVSPVVNQTSNISASISNNSTSSEVNQKTEEKPNG